MAILPLRSGSSTGIRLSNLPGLSSALSSVSGLFVAASITTPFCGSKPSISVSSWLSVCSRSSFEPTPPSLFLPMVSISSMNTMHGAFSLACLKRSLTLAAPMPTNISTNSEPDMEKNGTFASPATAFASSVLPVPGGPTSSAPLGSFAPIAAYFAGSCKKSTISCRDSFASSSPATSAKVLPVCASTYILALALPKLMALPILPALVMRFIISFPIKLNISTGSTHDMSMVSRGEACVGISEANFTPASSSRFSRVSSGHMPVWYMRSFPASSLVEKVMLPADSSRATSCTIPLSTMLRKSL